MDNLEILYHDEYLVAINKPSGLLVHKSLIDKKEKHFAMQILRNQIGQWVYPLHRLDKPTSGVLLFALSKEAAQKFSLLFQKHNIQKTYIAVVRGFTPLKGIINYPLVEKLDKVVDKKAQKNKPPQEAITTFKTLDSIELPFSVSKYNTVRYSLVELYPKTGRKHQLRRHMKHISHHILGDTKYGRGEHNKFIRKQFGIFRLLLHCKSIKFYHPFYEKEIVIQSRLPKEFSLLFHNVT